MESDRNSLLASLTCTEHGLLSVFPAFRRQFDQRAVQMELIAYLQRQHDRLAAKLR